MMKKLLTVVVSGPPAPSFNVAVASATVVADAKAVAVLVTPAPKATTARFTFK